MVTFTLISLTIPYTVSKRPSRKYLDLRKKLQRRIFLKIIFKVFKLWLISNQLR
jgi:hypothetical protein